MNHIKRSLAVLLALLLTLAASSPALAAESGSITASAGAAKAGERMTVTLSVQENPGFAALKLELSYDTDKLSFTGAENGSFQTNMNSFILSSGKVNLLWDKGDGDATGNGALAALHFTVKSGATGSANVSLRFVEANNWDLQSLQFNATGCTVAIDAAAGGSIGGGTGGGSSAGTGNANTAVEGATPTGTPQVEQPVSYQDVEAYRWFYDAVQYVTAHDLMNGVAAAGGPTLFQPNAGTSRCMVITVLARLYGADVSGGTPWYAKAVAWAQTIGVSDGQNPTNMITREQLVVMLYRYAQIKGFDTSAKAKLGAYQDAASVHSWATDAMQWAVGSELINGSNNLLMPRGTTTRAQLAAILMRFCENYSVWK
ncbi:MAG: S-layer homology domain-containing protein [Oscillospiraceae bacterium]|nr:S-layer homology domain-containing protein [Oscillospiraceae bacterium]